MRLFISNSSSLRTSATEHGHDVPRQVWTNPEKRIALIRDAEFVIFEGTISGSHACDLGIAIMLEKQIIFVEANARRWRARTNIRCYGAHPLARRMSVHEFRHFIQNHH